MAAESQAEPHFGFTRHGFAVHLRTVDHLPGDTSIQRFNKGVAAKVTSIVGSMWCAYFFSVLAMISLPAVLTEAFHLTMFPKWLVSVGLIAFVGWVAQTFLQLVLLSVIMVGQGVSQQASDARAAKTFEDVEFIIDKLDLGTEGGLEAINVKLDKLLKAGGLS
jgi:uncharacterized membrane protein YhaH (DUF805 family)